MDEKNIDLNVVWMYVKKILIMYALCSLIYLPLNCLKYGLFSKGITVGEILRYLYQCIFIASYTHLWYLSALAFAVIFVSLLLRKIGIHKILVIGVLLYSIGLLNQSYHGFIMKFEEQGTIFEAIHLFFSRFVGTSRNGLFEGVLFVAMGAKYAFHPPKLMQRKYLQLSILSFALYCIETVVLTKAGTILHGDLFVFIAPTVFFIFPFIANISIGDGTFNTKPIRDISTYIYLIHPWVIYILDKLVGSVVCGFQSILFFRFLLVASMSTIVGIAFWRARGKISARILGDRYQK